LNEAEKKAPALASERLLELVEILSREAATRRKAEKWERNDFNIAHNVQQKLFPQKTKLLATAEYSGLCVPAHEVGGDYYDFLDMGPGLLGLVLASNLLRRVAERATVAMPNNYLRWAGDFSNR
jgi:serine phosphatase RsbU (regulator of sigma subunit)